MKVSILIPTYNSSKTIGETIESVLNQEDFDNFEISLSDDGSKDDTRELLKKYKEKYPEKIRLHFNEENMGVVRNSISGFESVESEYIFSMGHDDRFLPDMLATEVYFLEAHKEYNACYSKAKIFLEEQNKFSGDLIGSDGCSFKDLLIHNNIPSLSCCIRTSVVKDYLKEIDPLSKNWTLEDYPLWLYTAATGRIKFLDEVHSIYRITGGSVMHKNGDDDIEMLQNVLDMKLFFAEKYARDDDAKQDFERLCNEGFSYEMANHYLYEDDMENFREYLKKSPKSLKVTLKYLFSLTAPTRKFLKSREQY